MEQRHLSLSHHDIYERTWENLIQLLCIWTSYVSLSDYLMLTLKFYTVPVHLHDVIIIVNQNGLSCKHVSIIFYCENMTSFLNYVTATLRTLYAWRRSFHKYIVWQSELIRLGRIHFMITKRIHLANLNNYYNWYRYRGLFGKQCKWNKK